MGSLYHQKGSRVYWITYSVNGRRYRESTRTTNRDKAQELLAEIERRLRHGEEVTPQTLTLEDMAESFLMDYVMNGKKSLDKAQRSVRHLYGYFGNIKARDITTTKVKDFITYQYNKGYANAEINRQTAALKRMFTLAIQEKRLYAKPHIPRLTESAPRRGFLEDDEFRAVHRELSEPIKPVALFAYYFGWRSHEVTELTWPQVDLRERCVRLDVGTTKDQAGREAYFPNELLAVILDQRTKTTALECQQRPVIPWVFHRDGKPIKDFRWDWKRACRQAGCPGKFFHDFRRTAYRNMHRLGIPENVIKDIIGHKTRSMAERYHITDSADRKEAARKMSGIVSDIVDPKSRQPNIGSQEPNP